MKSNPFRSLNRGIPTLGIIALLIGGSAPLLAGSRPGEPAGPRTEISTPPGSAERIAKLQADLKALQEEAANDPSRPTMAEVRRQLDRMIAERDAAAIRRSEVSRRERLANLSFGLNLVLALALLWVALRRPPTRTAP